MHRPLASRAASLPNVLFGCLLVFLLALTLMASFVPDIDVWSVHPASIVMVLAYLGGLQLIRSQSTEPMWEALQTAETVVDEIDPGPDGPAASGRSMWSQFLLVGGVAAVLGGNCLDALNLVAGDVAYRGGSIYHAIGTDQLFGTAAALLMTIVLVAGLLVRQPRGLGRIGFEGVTLILAYAAIVAVQVV